MLVSAGVRSWLKTSHDIVVEGLRHGQGLLTSGSCHSREFP